MLDLPAIKKRCEAGIPAMVSCPSTTEALHLTAEGYAYVGRLRTLVPQLVEELAEVQGKLARIELEACVCDQIRYPLSQGCIVHDKQSVIASILKGE